MEDNYLKEVLGFWNIDFKEVKKRLILYGSPERSMYRIGIADQNDSLFMLEKIAPTSKNRKLEIAKDLENLKSNDMLPLAVNYLPNNLGQYVTTANDELWMLTPYIQGVFLNQSTYLSEEWRGLVMADFLIALRTAQNTNFPFQNQECIYPIIPYVKELLSVMYSFNQTELSQLRRVIQYLEKHFFEVAPTLPLSFCHGDFHAANIVWGRHDVMGVIDWEFCGNQPELYDAANMLGCLGMENPSAFGLNIVKNFINQLKSSKLFSDLSWTFLFDLMLAQRFAWLSEWFRKNDEEMIDLEIVYMNLLLDNQEEIKSLWSN
jgi:homoserine kinase type II